MSNFSHCSDWSYASNHVAKRYIEKVETHVYFDDVRLQMDAKLWGEEYSRQPSAPKKVIVHLLTSATIKSYFLACLFKGCSHKLSISC